MKPIVKTMSLSSGTAILKSTKEDYISNVIAEDFNQTGDIIEPPYSVENLKALRFSSIYHRKSLKAVAIDTTMSGWTLNTPDKDDNTANKKVLDDLFNDYSFERSFFKAMEDYRTYGYGAVEIGRNKEGIVKGFKYIRSTTLRMCTGGEKALQQVGSSKMYFKIAGVKRTKDMDLDSKTGNFQGPETLDVNNKATELLWIGEGGPDSDYYEEPEYLSALLTILSDEYLRTYNNNTFITNGVPNYLITVTGNFEESEDEDGKTFSESLEDEIMDLQNKPGTAIVLMQPTEDVNGKIDINVTKISDEMKEASFEKFRESNRDEILAAHEVPPGRLGISKDGALGGAVDVERNKQYNNKTIRPLQRMLEQLINTIIVQGMMEIEDTTFQYRGLDTRNILSEIEIAEKLFNMSAMKPIEIRERFGDVFDLVMEVEGTAIIDYNPETDTFYMNGQPLKNLGDPPSNETPTITKSLDTLEAFKSEILGVIKDDISSKGTGDNRKIHQLIKKFTNQ